MKNSMKMRNCNMTSEFLASLPNHVLYKFLEIKRILSLDEITLLKKIVCRYLNCVSTSTEVLFLESTDITNTNLYVKTKWITHSKKSQANEKIGGARRDKKNKCATAMV